MLLRPAALFVCAAVLGGCTGGGEEAAACPTPVATDAADVLPEELPLAEFGTVTQAFEQGSDIVAEAISETSIVELYPPMARAVLDAGYEILSSENEGFEAEIFFAKGRRITGAYRLREGPCEGQVTIRMLFSRRLG